MTQRLRWTCLLGCIALLGAACASTPEPEPERPLSAHPFPTWVSELQPGETCPDAVVARFGEPDEIEDSVRGGQLWRYSFDEVRWPEDDPMRPVVAADGTLETRPPTRLQQVGRGLRKASNWLDSVFFYPPRQPRPPRTRRLPATIHRLELVFGVDGTLERYRYAPEPGRTQVAAEG